MPVSGVGSTGNIRTRPTTGTNLIASDVAQFLRDDGSKLKTVSLKTPMTIDGVAKQLHLSKATAAKVVNVAKGYQNFGIDTKIQASVILVPDKNGKEHQAVIVGGPTTEAGKSIWKPGQDYKATVIDGTTQADVMHVRLKAGDKRHFVYMSQA